VPDELRALVARAEFPIGALDRSIAGLEDVFVTALQPTNMLALPRSVRFCL
jgi:hypothetical protein